MPGHYGNKLKAWKEKRKAKQIARLGEKGKLVDSSHMIKTGEGTYKDDWDPKNLPHGDKHGGVYTDPKGKVTGEAGELYKISKKGKVKKRL